MSLVFGTEKKTSKSETFQEIIRNRRCRRPMLDLCNGDGNMRKKSSTYETMIPAGMVEGVPLVQQAEPGSFFEGFVGAGHEERGEDALPSRGGCLEYQEEVGEAVAQRDCEVGESVD